MSTVDGWCDPTGDAEEGYKALLLASNEAANNRRRPLNLCLRLSKVILVDVVLRSV